MVETATVKLDVIAGNLGGLVAAQAGANELVNLMGIMGTELAKGVGVAQLFWTTVGGAFASFSAQAAQAYGEFERGLKVAQAISGQTSSAIAVIGDQAEQMSVKFKIGIDQVTEGLTTLGRAGLRDVNSQLETLETGMQAAKLSGDDLSKTLNTIIQMTSLFSGNATSITSSNFGDYTEKITNLITATSNSAPLTFNDVAQAAQFSGGSFAAAGANLDNEYKLEDYMASIAAFARKGVVGSMAGTALRAFGTKPTSQDKGVTDALAEIGLTADDLWEEGGNEMKPISEQIGIIHNAMENLKISTMDQIEIWGKIVGNKMGQQMMKLNEDEIRDVKESIREAKSTSAAAEQTMNNFASSVSEANEQAQVLWRNFGERSAKAMQPAIQGITQIMKLLDNPIGAAFMDIGSIIIVYKALRGFVPLLKSIILLLKETINESKMVGVLSDYEKAEMGQVFTLSKMQQTSLRGFLKPLSDSNVEFDRLKKAAVQLNDEERVYIQLLRQILEYKKQVALANEEEIQKAKGTAQYARVKKDLDGNYNMNSAINKTLAKNPRAESLARQIGEASNPGDFGYQPMEKGYMKPTFMTPKGEVITLPWNFVDNIFNSKATLSMHAAGLANLGAKNYFELLGNTKDPKQVTEFLHTIGASDEGTKYNNKTGVFQGMIGQLGVAEQAIGGVVVSLDAFSNKLDESAAKIVASQEKIVNQNKQQNVKKQQEVLRYPDDLKEEEQMLISDYNATPKEIWRFRGEDPEEILAKQKTQVAAEEEQLAVQEKQVVVEEEQLAAQEKQITIQKTQLNLAEKLAEVEKNRESAEKNRENVEKAINQASIEEMGNQLKDLDKAREKTIELKKQVAFFKEMSEVVRGLNTTAVLGGLNPQQIRTKLRAEFKRLGISASDRPDYISSFLSSKKVGAGITLEDLGYIQSNLTNDVHSLQTKLFYNNNQKWENAILSSLRTNFEIPKEITDSFLRKNIINPVLKSINETSGVLSVQNFRGNHIGKIIEDKAKDVLKESLNPGPVMDRPDWWVSNPKVRYDRDPFVESKPRFGVDGYTGPNKYVGNNFIQLDTAMRKAFVSAYKSAPIGSGPLQRNQRERLFDSAVESVAKKFQGFAGSLGLSMEQLTQRIKNLALNMEIDYQQLSYAGEQLKNSMHGASLVGEDYRLNKDAEIITEKEYSTAKKLNTVEIKENTVAIGQNTLKQKLSGASESLKTGLQQGASTLWNGASKIGSGLMSAMMHPVAIAIEMGLSVVYEAYNHFLQKYNEKIEKDKTRLSEATESMEKSLEEFFKSKELEDSTENEKDKAFLETMSQIVEKPNEQLDETNQALYNATAQLRLANAKLSRDQADGAFGVEGWTKGWTAFESYITQDTGAGPHRKYLGQTGLYSENQKTDSSILLDEEAMDSVIQFNKQVKDMEDFDEAGKLLFAFRNQSFGDLFTTGDNVAGVATIKGNPYDDLRGFRDRIKDMSTHESAEIANVLKSFESQVKYIGRRGIKFDSKTGKLQIDNDKLSTGVQQLTRLANITPKQAQLAIIISKMNQIREVAEGQVLPILQDSNSAVWNHYDVAEYNKGTGDGQLNTQASIESYVQVISSNLIDQIMSQNKKTGATDATSRDPDGKAYTENDLIKGVTELAKNSSKYFEKDKDGNYVIKDGKTAEQMFGNSILYSAFKAKLADTDTVSDRDGKSAESKAIEGFWLSHNAADVDSYTRQLGSFKDGFVTRTLGEQVAANDKLDGKPTSSGSGSGSKKSDSDSNSNSDSGNKKRYVSLAICDKKEIPKLNVNLFKKPPSITVQNRNFKLRDIKINTQDKAKHVQSALKNAIIDVQKRSDPKIIQDEEGVYDPVGATDGDNLPSGAKTTR